MNKLQLSVRLKEKRAGKSVVRCNSTDARTCLFEVSSSPGKLRVNKKVCITSIQTDVTSSVNDLEFKIF